MAGILAVTSAESEAAETAYTDSLLSAYGFVLGGGGAPGSPLMRPSLDSLEKDPEPTTGIRLPPADSPPARARKAAGTGMAADDAAHASEARQLQTENALSPSHAGQAMATAAANAYTAAIRSGSSPAIAKQAAASASKALEAGKSVEEGAKAGAAAASAIISERCDDAPTQAKPSLYQSSPQYQT